MLSFYFGKPILCPVASKYVNTAENPESHSVIVKVEDSRDILPKLPDLIPNHYSTSIHSQRVFCGIISPFLLVFWLCWAIPPMSTTLGTTTHATSKHGLDLQREALINNSKHWLKQPDHLDLRYRLLGTTTRHGRLQHRGHFSTMDLNANNINE
ncbi:hypothetical protein BU25DRAFT_412492 [Macroventuria anomochaeta]|uniref:Uncharacterized protein n=1 Tax=Macroventuria anomochaeta TaxID=301207 RepID=A0ACB6RUQ7_9PLEO|nr:uncharacterized protein BU25DRAFT_412492 [Macroventuria anomochaeta]KAF2625442.1 hypothetical protein BU25DRAFT_412492 [Macroventuria anomochaeta]